MRRVHFVLASAGALAVLLLSGCERTQSEQRGYRGLGMLQVSRPADRVALDAVNEVPRALKKAADGGPTAAESYQNVQVLGDLSKAEFARLMLSFKSWLAPDEGCGYCHNAPDYASDEKYPKRVARLMIAMTRHINSDWQTHVKGTGVTCYTCHRGQAVPPKVWVAVPKPLSMGFMARRSSMRPPTPSAADSALPADPLSDFLLDDKTIRIVGQTALQTGNAHLIKEARSTYSMMTVMSESLGVNCTYCHNTRSFTSWELSPPPRVTAWHGIRMARELNNAYVAPLATLLPPERLGPTGDSPKVYCATCHLGTPKPLNGVNMVKDFPELIAPKLRKVSDASAAPREGSPGIARP
jgi:photosynthetic reaction center cytochrome c subunit